MFIYVLFNILTVCNIAPNSVRVCFWGSVKYDFVFSYNLTKIKVPDLAMCVLDLFTGYRSTIILRGVLSTLSCSS